MKKLPHIPSITPQLEAMQATLQHMQELIVARAAAHVLHPQTYFLPADTNSLEHHFVGIHTHLSKKGKEKFEANAAKIMGYMTQERREELGMLANIDYKSPLSIADQVKQMGSNEKYRIRMEDVEKHNELLSKLVLHTPLTDVQRREVSTIDPRGQNPRTLSLFVDSVHCEKTNDLRKDEISIFGTTIDALGRAQVINAFEVGKFKDGETISLGSKAKIRDFDLREPGFFPQVYVTQLFLVEKDLIDRNAELMRKILFTGAILSGTFLEIGGLLVLLSPIPTLGTVLGILGVISLVLAAVCYITTFVLVSLEDDLSQSVFDNFTFNIPPVIPVGTDFVRTLNFKIEGGLTGLHKAKYSAQLRWERTA